MPELTSFTPNVPVLTQTPAVAVAGTIPPGRYVFQLVVIDDLGFVSLPFELPVTVQGLIPPPPIPPIPPIPIT